MAQRSRRYESATSMVDRTRRYPISEAVDLLHKLPGANFDESVDICMKLGVDPRKSDQYIRGTFALPHGVGKEVRVVAFAEGEAAEQAKEAGAIEVGAKDLADKIQEGWMDFDVAVAHPSMMRFVGPLGRYLGPVGKMPSPKSGTVTDDVASAVKDFIAGKIEYRVDNGANIHAPVGRKSFDAKQLEENIQAFVTHMKGNRPAAAKGMFIRKAVISTTMGPGIKIEVGGQK